MNRPEDDFIFLDDQEPDDQESNDQEVIDVSKLNTYLDDLLGSKQEPDTNGPDEIEQQVVACLEQNGVTVSAISSVTGHTFTEVTVTPAKKIGAKRLEQIVFEIALATSSQSIPVISLPKGAFALQIPNRYRETVLLEDLLRSEAFLNAPAHDSFVLGCDVSRKPVIGSFQSIRHMVVAGSTGMGKTVALYSMLVSMLSRNSPKELQLVLVDPKHVEFSIFKNCPHLMCPILNTPKETLEALRGVAELANTRRQLLQEAGVGSIGDYTAEKLPRVLVVVDELADLMLTIKEELENAVCRIVACGDVGIHLILGTQRPTTDVLSGLLLAGIPARLALFVPSVAYSRAILNQKGAEQLLGRGDMLFKTASDEKPLRLQGAYMDCEKIENLCQQLKANGQPESLQKSVSPAVALLNDPAEPSAATDGNELMETVAQVLGEAELPFHEVVYSVSPSVTTVSVSFAQDRCVTKKAVLGIANRLTEQLERGIVRAALEGCTCHYEIPNQQISQVSLKELLELPAFRELGTPDAFALGVDSLGKPVYAQLSKLPHMLILGNSGSGKTTLLNTALASLLGNATPQQLKVAAISKELSELDGCPFLAAPVARTATDAITLMQAMVSEMEDRFERMLAANVRSIKEFNEQESEQMCRLLVLVDEPMELFSKKSNELASAMMRLSQKGRAAGITLILSTQSLTPRSMFHETMHNIPTHFVLKTDPLTARTLEINLEDMRSLNDHADGFYQSVGAIYPKRVRVANTSSEELLRVCRLAKQTYGSQKPSPLTAVEEN